ncbi:MAG: hypothetical protein FE834_07185, partial [Gammaproteobacteria bacterium]|nr:hypothetical protein [Gammaproteobacteria bacterium]
MSNDFTKTRWETIQGYGNQLIGINRSIEVTQATWGLTSSDITIPENALAMGHAIFTNFSLIDKTLNRELVNNGYDPLSSLERKSFLDSYNVFPSDDNPTVNPLAFIEKLWNNWFGDKTHEEKTFDNFKEAFQKQITTMEQEISVGNPLDQFTLNTPDQALSNWQDTDVFDYNDQGDLIVNTPDIAFNDTGDLLDFEEAMLQELQDGWITQAEFDVAQDYVLNHSLGDTPNNFNPND